MTTHKVGIIMNGVTGRMGTNQHLIRSIHAIRQQGGVPMPDCAVCPLMMPPQAMSSTGASASRPVRVLGYRKF